MIVIDMQNDFCAKGGWVDYLGVDYTPDRKPIKPLQQLLPALRKAGVPVIWVNWGNRPDLANMPPNQIHLYKPTGTGIGLGDPLPGNGAPRAAEGQLGGRGRRRARAGARDIKVDKYRISGFWDTPLDSILRNLGTRTVLFSGVNTDQCVLHSLTDANFLGYGCVLVEDCCATTSPDFCTEATVWNVQEVLRLRHRFGEDPESPEEVTKRLRHLVLLPGFMCDKDLWTDMVPDLAAARRNALRQRLSRTTRSRAWRGACSTPNRPSASCWSASRWAASSPACSP